MAGIDLPVGRDGDIFAAAAAAGETLDHAGGSLQVDEIMERNQDLSLVNQLSGFKPESAAVCAKVVKIMFYVGTKLVQTRSLYSDILKKIDLLSSYSDSDANVKAVLLGIIAEHRLSNYVSDFLFSECRSLEKYFSFEEIKELETNYLKEAIRQDLPLVKVYDYMYRATYKGSDYKVNERANKLFKKYADKHIEEFLQSQVSYMRPNGGYYSVSPFAQKVWGSWADFQKYVQSISPRTPIIEEFILFLDKYLKNGADAAIPYKFRHIKIKRE